MESFARREDTFDTSLTGSSNISSQTVPLTRGHDHLAIYPNCTRTISPSDNDCPFKLRQVGKPERYLASKDSPGGSRRAINHQLLLRLQGYYTCFSQVKADARLTREQRLPYRWDDSRLLMDTGLPAERSHRLLPFITSFHLT
jgi:hypothetical protein